MQKGREGQEIEDAERQYLREQIEQAQVLRDHFKTEGRMFDAWLIQKQIDDIESELRRI